MKELKLKNKSDIKNLNIKKYRKIKKALIKY